MKNRSTLFMFCMAVLTLLTAANAAGEARWKFHFTYGQCPGGDLEVWSTQNCQRMQKIFSGYAKTCKDYEGIVPGDPANDVMFDFYWDYWCNNEDHFKIAVPSYNGSEWELVELPPWIEAQVLNDLDLPLIGDPTGWLQDIYVVVNLERYLNERDPIIIDSFFDVYTELDFVDGENPDLPGYLVSEDPIVFDPNAYESESPFETNPDFGPLNGRLSVDGRLTLYELVESDPLNPEPAFVELNWIGSIQPNPASPAWGRVNMDVTLPRGIYYFNLVLGDGRWPIANMSVESAGGSQTVSAKFNLGPPGTTQIEYQYCGFSPVPLPTQPTGPIVSADVYPLPYQIGFEDDVTVELIDPTDWEVDICPVKVSGSLSNIGSFENQPQGQNECAPGAISNSLKYLQANGKIPASKDTSIAKVGSVIGTTSSGTPSSWYQKKQNDSYFTDVVTTRYITTPLTLEKCQELAEELKDGQDIEMDLNGHVEVLAGIRVKCNNTVELDLFDDNQSDTESDPMHTSPLVGALGTAPQYVDGMELERFVIECPAEKVSAYTFIDTQAEWIEALSTGKVRALTQEEGDNYLAQWNEFYDPETGGEAYPDDPFLPAELYVHEGIGGPYGEDEDIFLEDAGLVMAWGQEGLPETDFTSAWALKYDQDPDLSNCIITLVVTAPQFSFISGNQINNVSFGLGGPPIGTGPVRSWSWACGPGNPIPWNTPVTIKIDTSKTGMTAATPTATGYVSNPGFNIQNVTWMTVDENGTWVGGPSPAPGPGGFQFMWNYWHWILVSPRTTVNKGIYKKWSQAPVVIDPNDDPPLIQGWDELSNYNMPVVADDWECSDDRPVTDIHWWGSFFKIIDPATGETEPWTQPTPPTLPNRFHIGIWTDVPDPNANDPDSYSHPGMLVWENYCDNFVWNFAGYDQDPRQGFLPHEPGNDTQLEACFQFTQLLSQDEWFYQKPTDANEPNIYWLSIAPIWENPEPEWEWGWKSRPHYFNDDAVSIQQADPWWPPIVNTTLWTAGIPIQWPPYPNPEGVTWDMAFELTTNEPAYIDDPIEGDISGPDGLPDGEVNLIDLSVIAAGWLTSAP